MRGWQAACDVCEVSWGGGETPALAGVVAPGSIDLAASCVGIVPSRAHLTLGDAAARRAMPSCCWPPAASTPTA